VHQAADQTARQPRSAGLQRASSTDAPIWIQGSRSNVQLDEEWRAAQNIFFLPFQYGPRLDRGLTSRNALYALSELFRFAALVEVQFLNLLQNRIEHELSFVGAEDVS
jgi:hypothetical protein